MAKLLARQYGFLVSGGTRWSSEVSRVQQWTLLIEVPIKKKRMGSRQASLSQQAPKAPEPPAHALLDGITEMYTPVYYHGRDLDHTEYVCFNLRVSLEEVQQGSPKCKGYMYSQTKL